MRQNNTEFIENKVLLPHQYYYPALQMMEDRVTPEKKEKLLSYLAEGKRNVLLYMHFPFCDSKCAFCGFEKRYELEEITRYVTRIKEELLFYSKYNIRIQNIHLGGGTPTLLPGKMLSELIAFVKEHFECAPDMDINIEGSCTSIWRDDIIEFIKDSGITRTSIGVQTFDPRMREVFETKASIDEVYKTIETLKKNQIGVFTDILFGYPDFGVGDTPEDIVKSDIREAIRLNVEGIDFSQIFPYGNRLHTIIEAKGLKFPSTQAVTSHMTECMDYMESCGYHQNTSYGFVKDGRIIMETSYYGGMEEVSDTLAIGCSAFGLLNGFKYRNAMYGGYMRRSVPAYMQVKELTDWEKDCMNIVSFSKLLVLSKQAVLNSVHKDYFLKKLEFLKTIDMVQELDDRYVVTKKGRLYVDNIYYFMLDENEQKVVDHEMQKVTFD